MIFIIGVPFNGRVWTDGKTVWPDFTHKNTETYWYNMFKDYHDQVAFDGAWIDMNEPSNFYNGQQFAFGCEKSKWNNPPYVPRSIDGGKLFHKTICPSAKQALGTVFENPQKSLIQHCVYILSGQKFIKNAKNSQFWRVFENLKLVVKQCYQTCQF